MDSNASTSTDVEDKHREETDSEENEGMATFSADLKILNGKSLVRCSLADVQSMSLAFRTSGYWETVSLMPWSGRVSANAMPKSHSTCGGRTLQVTCPAIGSCEGRGGGSRSEWSDTRRLRKRVGWKSVDMPCK